MYVLSSKSSQGRNHDEKLATSFSGLRLLQAEGRPCPIKVLGAAINANPSPPNGADYMLLVGTVAPTRGWPHQFSYASWL